MKLLMFTKHLQDLPLEKMADVVRDLGFDGLDVTTRTGGTIAPENVTEELPRVIDVCAARGLEIGMLTTEITSADHDHGEAIFQAASDAGIKFLKLGYFHCGDFGGLSGRLDEIRGRLEGLAPMSRRYGVTACVHTHSGDTFPPSGSLLYLLVQGLDPDEIGAYVDPGHMTIEGGVSAWRMGLDLLAPQIRLAAVKDFGWITEDDPGLGKPAWLSKLVPLNEGVVRWPEVFWCLRQIGYDGYLSVHSEYQGSHSFRDMTTEEVIDQTRLDMEYLTEVIADSAGIA